MKNKFSDTCYPLHVQCGRGAWTGTRLTEHFQRSPRPQRTFFRHLLADYLRPAAAKPFTAAELELWATLNLVLRRVAEVFLERRNGRIGKNRVEVAGQVIEMPELEQVFSHFLQVFPALPVELRETDIAALLSQLDSGRQSKELLLEVILLFVQARNPALERARNLFASEEQVLQEQTGYRSRLEQLDALIPAVDDGFAGQPQSLLGRLLEPLLRATTLPEQLLLLRQLWAEILPEDLLARIATAFDQFEKEGMQFGFPGEPELVVFSPAAFADEEYANFTADTDWMPRTVLLAKSTYVWLAQLSAKYRREVRRLDQIPDAELDELAGQGFSSLWLIGLWKRSKASLKVKQLCGQVQVAASAYAIDEYVVADDLGGNGALENLKERCRQRGIDLACDVVTNHTGIESAWLREHPDWFIQLPYPPYPGYRFSGPDLSEDPEYLLQIEDGYFDHSEAAVVCRYQHRHSGQVRYIYHGNDGTHLPWNDTAQLDYLLPQLREAMIQLIIRVARDFRIIRFDAAMTLAKRHFQRLWYPLPGGGAGVPSRSDHAMSKEDFDRAFPIEFWRELVDRVRREAPDTLLIAEAFWLMEGYFVRTLGMHRVYNSAFMNMLKREENAKYRETLKNILEFDPAILQRFVNFMSNPDEKPAIEQFGDGDKYYCVATMLATMPGLPMFGHGQIEGLKEKYGMEYLTPRWEEQPDRQMVERHGREIFPLLRRRALFSGAGSFQLYDFESVFGVEQDVFAYSNRLEEQSVLILCNNSNKYITGRIGPAVYMADKDGIPFQRACSVDTGRDFVLMSDLASGHQYLQPGWQLAQGGEFQLPPYARRVLTGFTPLFDHDGRWQQLWQRFGDHGARNYYLERDALLLQGSAEDLTALLALERPERCKRAIESLLVSACPRYLQKELQGMSRAYLLELMIHIRWPEQELGADAGAALAGLLERCSPLDEKGLYLLLEGILNHRQLRRLCGAHYYDFVDWFDQAGFEQLLLLVLEAELARLSPLHAQEPITAREQLIGVLRQLQRAGRVAEQVGFRCDHLLQRLDRTRFSGKPIPAKSGGLKILFVASEATPFAKSGGLADVAGSLPRALRQLGHDVLVVIPCYRTTAQNHELVKLPHSVQISMAGQAWRASLKEAVYDGVPFVFIDTPEFFDRDELYGTADGDFADNGLRFGFFCRAALETARVLDFQPDLIHHHDWQTGLLPVLLKTVYRGQDFFAASKTLLTIHNLGYQGRFPLPLLDQLELPWELGRPDGLEYYGSLSFLKGGIVFADLINTVSPTYCQEIQQPQQGHGFDGILRSRSLDLYGIINGLDGRGWDPQIDVALARHYSATNLAGKVACKKALQQELGLEIAAQTPLVAVISRLDRQKGIDLIEAIWPQLLERDLQFVLLGSGNHQQMDFWRREQERDSQRVAIHLTFNEGLSRRLYAAADLLLVPSLYEPCGLTQMIALKYGALPVVRRTGGLADTVVDLSENPRQGNGFVFPDSDPGQLLAAIDRGLQLYARRRVWNAVVKRGMQQDFSWENSARQYEEHYRSLVDPPAAG